MIKKLARGYYGVGCYHIKTEHNIGTLMRSAYNFGASFVYTIGRRYKPQASDTTKTYRHLPLYHYLTFDDFYANLPHDCRLIGVELHEKAIPIKRFEHFERSVYIFGPEDGSIKSDVLNKCNQIIKIPGVHCMNVAACASIVMFDRINKNDNL